MKITSYLTITPPYRTSTKNSGSSMRFRCQSCQDAFQVDAFDIDISCPTCNHRFEIAEYSVASDNGHRQNRLDVGQRIAHYEIIKFISPGSDSDVYHARDPRLQRDVVIQVARKLKDPSRLHALISTAQTSEVLSDSNLVSVQEIGKSDDDFYIVSDFVDGINLAKWAHQIKRDPIKIAGMLEKVARAVGRAHTYGILYRDLQPSNILVDADGEPKIIDFGSPAPGVRHDTTVALASPSRMSPEQAIGDCRLFEPRSDVYSLGAILYELLSGMPPFSSNAGLEIEQIVSGKYPRLSTVAPSIPPALAAVQEKAMSVNLGNRYESASEFAEELRRFRHEIPTTASLERKITPKSFLSDNLLYIVACVALIFLFVIASFKFLESGNSDNVTPAALNNHQEDQPEAIPLVKKPRPEVFIDVSPQEAILGISHMNFDENRLAAVPAENVSHVGEGQFVIRDLESGWYILEAFDRSVGIQEVVRYVPESINESFPNELFAWSIKNEQVHLKPITILPGEEFATEQVIRGEKYLKVDGGRFTAGSKMGKTKDRRLRLPLQKNKLVHPFYMSETEVTAARYAEVIRKIKGEQEVIENRLIANYPEVGRSFFEAAAYCEYVGGRLMTFDEYVFAATNGGKTLRPWGNSEELVEFKYQPVGSFELDQTMGPAKIKGLYSGCREWTIDFSIPLGRQEPRFKNNPMTACLFDNRIVVGGEDSVVLDYQQRTGLADFPEERMGPRFWNPRSPHDRAKDLGFRCVRSTVPRIIQYSSEEKMVKTDIKIKPEP